MNAMLILLLACLAVPCLAAEVKLAGVESSGIYTKVLLEPPSNAAKAAIYSAYPQNYGRVQEAEPMFYDAQARRRTGNRQSHRNQPSQVQLNHEEITNGQIKYQKNYQTRRVSSTPNRLQNTGNWNQNSISGFNRPGSKFSSQLQSIAYDRNGNPIRGSRRPVIPGFSTQIASQHNRYANGQFPSQIGGNYQAFQNGFQQSGNRFGNRPVSSQGASFPNSQQVGSTFPNSQQVGSTFPNSQQIGSSFPNSQQVGSTFPNSQQVGSTFPISQQVGSTFPNSQQVGSAFPISQQVGSTFPNSQQVGSAFQRVQTPISNLNAFPGGAFPLPATNNLQGNRFLSRPSSGFLNSQINNRRTPIAGLQNNIWDRQQVSGFSDGQYNRQGLPTTGLQQGYRPLYQGSHGSLSSQQLVSARYPSFTGSQNTARWQQGFQGNQFASGAPSQYVPNGQQFGSGRGGFGYQPTKNNVGYQVQGNSLT